MKSKKWLVAIYLLVGITVFASEKTSEDIRAGVEIEKSVEMEKKAADYFEVYDPWEGFNRRVYAFNYYFDKYFFLPAVETYRFLAPNFAQDRVTDFFSNVGQSSTMLNSAIQGKGRKAMRSLARFSINSILGIFGIFDVASKLDMPKEYEDVGLTLAHYGMKPGPYLVLPILGPSNLRDGTGTVIAFATAAYTIPYEYIEGIEMTSIGVRAIQSVDTRKNNRFRYYGTGSPFEYEYIRFFYKEFRELQENND